MFVRDCRQHRYREFLGAVANVIAKVDHRVVRERDRFFAREVRAVGARYFDSPKRSGVDKEPIDDALIDFALVAIPISVGRIEDHEEFASAYFALSSHQLTQPVEPCQPCVSHLAHDKHTIFLCLGHLSLRFGLR